MLIKEVQTKFSNLLRNERHSLIEKMIKENEKISFSNNF
jgi:hypothetical protein